MISWDDYAALDGVGMAALVRAGEVSAAELLEAAIARAEAVNPELNAIVIRAFELARTRAREQLAGPFAGVPFLIKDLYQDHAGVRATAGCRALKNAGHVPSKHAEIVARWLRAGTVIFGSTNTPEFGAKGITEPDAWGPTRNPWAPARSPGGSSGGAAAAVAAGIVPLAGASDGGGSIRIPSAFTGLFGFKPGRGRTPIGPDYGEALHGAAVNHVVTRSVRDSAVMLDATHGPENASLFQIVPPVRPYAEEVERDPGVLRIAFSTRSPIGSKVHPDAIAGVTRSVALLQSLGHEVEEAAPAIDGLAMARDFTVVWMAHLALSVEHTRRDFPARSMEFELDTLAMVAVAKAKSSLDYAESYVRWTRYTRQLSEFMAGYDVYLTPTIARPASQIGERTTPAWAEGAMRLGMPLGLSRLIPLASDTIEQAVMSNLERVPFTQLANITGAPAMSVPLETFTDGMPLGMQFLAQHGREGLLFSLAGQLERAAPWARRNAWSAPRR